MYKIIIVIAVIIIVIVAAVLIFMPKGADIKQFEHLLNPVISELPDQNMLVVEVIGKPDESAGKAMKLIYQTYYKLDGVKKSLKIKAPRARWPLPFDTPHDQWIGIFALPIPDSVTTLPEIKNPDNLKIYIEKWQYGTTAEILHTGPYDLEDPTVQRLTDYVTEQGYQIVGVHEEEYVKGPGMFGPGNPDKYLTIIRYQVEKLPQQ